MNKYEGSEKAKSNLRKKHSTEPNKPNAKIMSNIVQEDDKSSYKDLEVIANENFGELLSRKENALLSDVDNVDVDDDDDEEEEVKEEQEMDEEIEEKEEMEEEIDEEEVEENEEIDAEVEQQDISDTI